MYPSLFGLTYLHTYGLFIGIGIVSAMYAATQMGKENHIKEKTINRLLIAITIAGVVGARLLFVIVENPSYFLENPMDILKIYTGGGVIYGSILGAIPVIIYYSRKHKIPVLKSFDIITTTLPLGLGIGRIGCFAAGCCYGKPITDSSGNMITDRALAPWFSVKFPEGINSLAPTTYYMYPSQLFDAGFNILIFAILFGFRKHLMKQEGRAFWLFLIMYGTFRSIAELYRGDTQRGFLIQGYLSTSQAISIPLILYALYMLFIHKKKHTHSQ